MSTIPTTRPRRFSVQQELGTSGGGMNGGIAIVKDRTTGVAYIEKTMTRNDVSTGAAAREIRYLQQVAGHPHITKIVGSYLDPRKKEGSIIMEYCDLGSMERLMQRHAQANRQLIGEHHLWMWFIQIADALSFCYNGPENADARTRSQWNFIIHRDIKPANILLARAKDGAYRGLVVAKLADFGCAKSKNEYVSGTARPWNQSAYTEIFRPPERPAYKQTSDVWQLGAVMICLCNLKLDWYRVYNWRRRPAGGYSDLLNTMINRCMADDPDKRITSSRLKYELNLAYGSIKDHLPPAAEPLLPWKNSSTTQRSSR